MSRISREKRRARYERLTQAYDVMRALRVTTPTLPEPSRKKPRVRSLPDAPSWRSKNAPHRKLRQRALAELRQCFETPSLELLDQADATIEDIQNLHNVTMKNVRCLLDVYALATQVVSGTAWRVVAHRNLMRRDEGRRRKRARRLPPHLREASGRHERHCYWRFQGSNWARYRPRAERERHCHCVTCRYPYLFDGSGQLIRGETFDRVVDELLRKAANEG